MCFTPDDSHHQNIAQVHLHENLTHLPTERLPTTAIFLCFGVPVMVTALGIDPECLLLQRATPQHMLGAAVAA